MHRKETPLHIIIKSSSFQKIIIFNNNTTFDIFIVSETTLNVYRKETPLHIIIKIIIISINHHLHQQHDLRHLHCLRNNTHRASQRNTSTHHKNHPHFKQSSSSSTTRPSTFASSEKQHSTCIAEKHHLLNIITIILILNNHHLHQQHDLRHLHCLRNNTHRAS